MHINHPKGGKLEVEKLHFQWDKTEEGKFASYTCTVGGFDLDFQHDDPDTTYSGPELREVIEWLYEGHREDALGDW